MRNIKKAETLDLIQSFTSYSQIVPGLAIEILNPRNESRDPENEIYIEQIEEFKVALERCSEALDKLKNANLV